MERNEGSRRRLSSAYKVCFFVFLSLTALNCLAAPVETPTIQAFEAAMGPESVRGEQLGPLYSPRTWTFWELGKLFAGFLSDTGGIGATYQPGNRQVFEVPVFLMPEAEAMPLLTQHPLLRNDPALAHFTVVKDGKRYTRVFLHPQNTPMIEELERKHYPRDTVKWYGTPTSSSRTLYILSPFDASVPFPMMKTSLPKSIVIAGADRDIHRRSLARQVGNSDFIADVYVKTGGKLPGGMRWSFMPEVIGVSPFNGDGSGSVARLHSLNVDLKRYTEIPYLDLISRKPGTERWVDRMFAASGEKDKKKYVWEKIIKPLLDLHIMLSMENGIATELHQQNAVLVINNETLQPEVVSFRDTEGLRIDRFYRHEILKIDPNKPFDARPVALDRSAQDRQVEGVLQMYIYNVSVLARQALPPAGAAALMRQSERYLVDDFNRRFPKFKIPGLHKLAQGWERVHRSITPDPAPGSDYVRERSRRAGNLIAAQSSEILFDRFTRPFRVACHAIFGELFYLP